MSTLKSFYVSSLCLLAMLFGCGGGGPVLAPVSGKVTLDDKPIASALLTFFPKGNEGTTSYGRTNEKGDYTLQFSDTEKGCMLGQYGVKIEIPNPEPSDDNPTPKKLDSKPLPKKYRGNEIASFEIKPGRNVCDIKLESGN